MLEKNEKRVQASLIKYIFLVAVIFSFQEIYASGDFQAGDLAAGIRHLERLRSLNERVSVDGEVRVIIGLKMFSRPEGYLQDATSIAKQQIAIGSLQNKVLNSIGRLTKSSRNGVKIYKTIPYIGITVDASELNELQNNPDVISIEEDAAETLMLSDTIPQIGADIARDSGYTGNGQTIAIIDSGILKDHGFLNSSVVEEACFGTNSPRSGELVSLCPGGVTEAYTYDSARDCQPGFPSCGHGTHVAGIAAGRQGTWPSAIRSGVAPESKIIAIKAVTLNNLAPGNLIGGSITPLRSDTLRALERVYELKNAFKIAAVNMSLGSSTEFYKDTASCDAANPSYKAAIDNLRSFKIATIVASGNSNHTDSLPAPACISSAISVGSVTKVDVPYWYANSADFLNLLAPGGDGTAPLPQRILSSGLIRDSVSSGSDFICGIKSDRTVNCSDRGPTPTQGQFESLSSGYEHVCGLAISNGLTCFGSNVYGETTPPANLILAKVSAGDYFNCGIRFDNINNANSSTLACWGLNDQGQSSPPNGLFVDVDAGGEHACAVRRNGELACWGANTHGQATPPGGAFIQVSAGYRHSCAVGVTGQVLCWGDNLDGQSESRPGPYTQVSAGFSHTCGIRDTGYVDCWGQYYGSNISNATFTTISAGETFTCGTRTGGDLDCWGNFYSSLSEDLLKGFVYKTGTSMAAPHVTGAWAVLKSVKPEATVDEVLNVLRTTGRLITNPINGVVTPRINLNAAVIALLQPKPILSVGKTGSGSGLVSSVPQGIDCGGDCTEEYESGTNVTLSAKADSSSVFTGWGGACYGTGDCVLTMDLSRNVTANFEKSYPLIILKAGTGSGKVIGLGIDCGNYCTNKYASGTLVSLTATADAGSVFTGWSGWSEACSGTGDCSVVMNSAKNITASFSVGSTNNPDLLLDSVTSPATGTAGGRIRVAAMARNQGNANAEPFTLDFYFSKDASIDVNDIASGYGCNMPALAAGNIHECSGDIGIPDSLSPGVYYLGAIADSRAVVPEGNESNNTKAASNTITISPQGSEQYQLKIVRPVGGIITSVPEGISCSANSNLCAGYFSSVTLSATPDQGYYLKNWVGCLGGDNLSCSLTLTRKTTVKAIFSKLPKYLLKIVKSPYGSITSEPAGLNCKEKSKKCSAKFVRGTEVVLDATSAPGHSFSGWGGACSGMESCVMVIDGPKNVSAFFE